MKIFFTLGLLALSLSLSSQELNKLIPATINFENGISESVLISTDYLNNSKSIRYQSSANNSSKTAVPEIVNNISADDSSFFLQSYEQNGKHYFLQLAVGGAADLYYYFDNSNWIKYIVYNDKYGFKELNNSKSLVQKQGKKFSQNSREYLGVLSLIFSDCDAEIDYKNIRLKIQSLSNSFINYNQCKNELNFSSKSLKSKNKFRIALTGGADINSLNTNTPVASNGKGEANFTIGTELVFIPAFFNSSLTPFISLNYSQTGGKADYLSTPEFDKLILEMKLIEIYTGLRYNLLARSSKINPFVGVSMGKSFLLNHNTSIMKVSLDNSSPSVPLYDGNPYKVLGKSMKLGFHYQLGFNYQLSEKQGLIFKADYSSMFEDLGEFQFNRFRLEGGYYFDL